MKDSDAPAISDEERSVDRALPPSVSEDPDARGTPEPPSALDATGSSEDRVSEPPVPEPPVPEPPVAEPPAPPPSTPEPPSFDSSVERFEAFRQWLDEQGPRFQVWANDCIFIGIKPPVLELEFPEGFRLSHVSVTERDAELLDGLVQFFPNCTRIQLRHRGEDSTRLTHREERAKEAHDAQRALEEAVADHADIQTLIEHFDAAIRSVHKDHRAPVPPALVREESP